MGKAVIPKSRRSPDGDGTGHSTATSRTMRSGFLVPSPFVTFLLDQWYTFQLKRKGYKVDFTKEAKKKRDELRDKYYGFEPIKGLKKKQPSRADNIHALTQVTRAALDRNSEPAQDGEGLRQRIGGASVPPELAETELTGEVTKKSE